jgi:hypothetical protein
MTAALDGITCENLPVHGHLIDVNRGKRRTSFETYEFSDGSAYDRRSVTRRGRDKPLVSLPGSAAKFTA